MRLWRRELVAGLERGWVCDNYNDIRDQIQTVRLEKAHADTRAEQLEGELGKLQQRYGKCEKVTGTLIIAAEEQVKQYKTRIQEQEEQCEVVFTEKERLRLRFARKKKNYLRSHSSEGNRF